jgi:hypothetical protein
VNGSREQLLSGARFAEEEHRNVRGRDAPKRSELAGKGGQKRRNSEGGASRTMRACSAERLRSGMRKIAFRALGRTWMSRAAARPMVTSSIPERAQRMPPASGSSPSSTTNKCGSKGAHRRGSLLRVSVSVSRSVLKTRRGRAGKAPRWLGRGMYDTSQPGSNAFRNDRPGGPAQNPTGLAQGPYRPSAESNGPSSRPMRAQT